jgi:hypothetical protein
LYTEGPCDSRASVYNRTSEGSPYYIRYMCSVHSQNNDSRPMRDNTLNTFTLSRIVVVINYIAFCSWIVLHKIHYVTCDIRSYRIPQPIQFSLHLFYSLDWFKSSTISSPKSLFVNICIFKISAGELSHRSFFIYLLIVCPESSSFAKMRPHVQIMGYLGERLGNM